MYTENEIYQYSEYMDWCRHKICLEYKELSPVNIEIDNVQKVQFVGKTTHAYNQFWDINYTVVKWVFDTKTKRRKKMKKEWGTILLNSYETWLNEKKMILRNERIDELLNGKNL